MASPRRRTSEPRKRIRCGIYTRKSHEEGLDQDFNSLDQQRESAEAYIESQKLEGWFALPERYDDAAFSARTMDRPALQKLLVDVERGHVDIVVIYKIDRLSRSLRDFGRLMDVFDQHGVSFVSVTQRFDTSSSMGKLTLNILMSFAEFEREVIGERIRDKIAAHKRRGKHTGGMPVLGYDTDREAKRLVVNAKEARLVRRIFRRFSELGSTTALAAELNRQSQRTKEWTTLKGKVQGGRRWTKSHLYRLLNNPKYIGKVEHRGEIYPGEHEAIVSEKLWDEAHRVFAKRHKAPSRRTRAETQALLRGIIRCAHCGCSMGPTSTKKNGRSYRYYICVCASKNGYDTCPVKTVAAGEIEEAVVEELRAVCRSPELIAPTLRAAQVREADELERLRGERAELEAKLRGLAEKAGRLLDVTADGASSIAEELRLTGGDIDEVKRRLEETTAQISALYDHALTEREVIEALPEIDPLWDELFPAEQARIVKLLVERVEVREDGLEVRLRCDGIRSLVAELGGEKPEVQAR
ncbi:MAG: recombinase family protein [Deltaproteobacteria bacterium]|nr:recombinase family protein [Deltaproteobacteria bacterium]